MPDECAGLHAKASCNGLQKGCNDICTHLEMKDILRSMEPADNNGQAVRDELERVLSSGDGYRAIFCLDSLRLMDVPAGANRLPHGGNR